MNHKSGSGFCGATVLVGWRGQDVSFNTTVGDVEDYFGAWV